MKKTLSILIFAITSWTNAAAQNIDSAAVETLMDQAWEEILSQDNAAVSYTHLTLPTNREV